MENQQQLKIGTIIGGRYRIEQAVGQGGMAYVYLAGDLSAKRSVALKVMRDELSGDPEFIRRFATEARAAASLDHPNIVRVLDYGQDGDVRYIIQEYVQGVNLKELIRRNHGLRWDLAVPLMIQIALGLEHAHKRGIIHRDMKPQNVLVTPQMEAKVTDFGIARASIANTITLTGGVAFGSVHYFSPEQARGSKVTERSDLYSLGIILYEMLTGVLPFDGESSVAVAIKQLQEMPTQPRSLNPEIPPGLEDIIYRAIQKSPDRRYQSAREFVDDLDAFMIDPQHFQARYPHSARMWSSNSAALTTDKGSSNFGKVEEIERRIDARRRSRLRMSAGILIFLVLAIAGLVYLLTTVVHRFTLEQRLSNNAETLVVERYVGRQVNEVEAELREIYGDQYELIPVRSETQEEGIIFEQDPNYGTKQKRSERHISLKYSVGKQEMAVPDVLGLEEEKARKTLQDAGFVPVIRPEKSETTEEGRVIRSEPAAGSKAFSGTRVMLYISRPEQILQVPELVGLSWADASALASSLGFELSGINAHSAPDGTPQEVPEEQRVILKQSPEEGSSLKKGDTIQVSYGLPTDTENGASTALVSSLLQMPDLSNMTVSQVQSTLSALLPAGAAGFNLLPTGNTDLNSPDARVSQVSLAAGTSFDPYSTVINVYFEAK